MTHIIMSSRRAVLTTTQATSPSAHRAPQLPHEAELVRLHAQACNAMHTALHHLTGPDCTPVMWAMATARAHRALSALKQASALVNQVGG